MYQVNYRNTLRGRSGAEAEIMVVVIDGGGINGVCVINGAAVS